MKSWYILQGVGYQTCNMLFASSQHFFSQCAMLLNKTKQTSQRYYVKNSAKKIKVDVTNGYLYPFLQYE
jgi:hypothetical protein